MGRAFAARALSRGHEVRVWNRTPGRATELVASGAIEARTVTSAVGGTEVALVVVADDDALLGVCLGAEGVLASLPPAGVLATVSTVSPDTVGRLAASADRVVIDAPVVGSPEMILNGNGQFLVGGPRARIEALQPLWDDLGASYTHCGPLGSGVALKLVLNMLLITGVSAMAEGIATARGHGLSDDLLREVLAHSPMVSPASLVRLEGVLDPSHPGWFTPQLARKDVRLANDLARQSGVEPRMGPAAETLLSAVIGTDLSWADFAAVIEAYG